VEYAFTCIKKGLRIRLKIELLLCLVRWMESGRDREWRRGEAGKK
jgi:hypothetical protein